MKTNHDGLTPRIMDDLEIHDIRALQTVNVNATQLGEDLVANRTPIIELNSSYGTSALRDIQSVTGSGEITDGLGTIDLSTGATADSTAHLESAEIGRYIPGYSAQLGLGILVPDAPTGNQVARWGGEGESEENALQFGYDATGLFVSVLKDGVEQIKSYQSDWNIDPLDGTGRSDYVLDVSAGAIFQIEFTWYGFGEILFGVIGYTKRTDGTRTQRFLPCHSYRPAGSVSIQSPNLRVFADVNNGGDAADLALSVGGRQYSIVGNYIPKYRFTGDKKAATGIGTTVEPLITFRRKTGFGDRSIKVQGFEVLNVANAACYVEIRLDGTLTGATYGTPDNYSAAETALERDKSATAITGGEVIWAGTVIGAGQNKGASGTNIGLDFDVPNGSALTLCAATFSGTTDVISGFIMREEW